MSVVSRGAVVAAVALTLTACTGGSATPQPPETPAASSSTPDATPTEYTSPPAALPTEPVALSTAAPPWLPPAVVDASHSADYVRAAGLPSAEEMLEVHYHAHLDIINDGKAVEVPAYLGFVVSDGKVSSLAPLHTHNNSGLIHIENSVPATFVLGQFFVEWGVRFTPKCVGGLCAGDGKELAVFVDGKRYAGDPTRLVLRSHQEIAIEYGDTGSLPTPPSSYDFPSGD